MVLNVANPEVLLAGLLVSIYFVQTVQYIFFMHMPFMSVAFYLLRCGVIVQRALTTISSELFQFAKSVAEEKAALVYRIAMLEDAAARVETPATFV